MTRLIIESGPNKGMIFPLSDKVSSIGRSAANTVHINDKRISRLHAEIYFKDDEYYIRDLESKNGTHVNGILISGSYKLSSNDSIKMGETTIIFDNEAPSQISKKSKKQKETTEITTHSVKIVRDEDWIQMEEIYATKSDPYFDKVELKTPVPTIDLKEYSKKLAILYQIADSIRSILNLDDLLEKIIDTVIRIIPADRGVLLLFDENTNELIPKVIRAKGTDSGEEIIISESIVEKSIKEKVSILVSDANTDKRFSASESIVFEKIHSAICAPIICKDDVLGVIYLDSRTRFVSFAQDELELLTSISNQSALAISNAKLHTKIVEQKAFEKEMEIARNIHRNLLPKEPPEIPNFEIAALNVAAKKVSGDYYDFIPLPDGRWAIIIADVSGKGVPAALLISMVRSHFRTQSLLMPIKNIFEIVSTANKMICKETSDNMFVALVYGMLNGNNGEFEYINAGHTYPILFKKNKNFDTETLEVGGCFLGIEESTKYKVDKITFERGDILLLFTDGVTDAQNSKGEFFGAEALVNFVKKHNTLNAHKLCDSIYKNVKGFMESTTQFDDFTLIVIKAL